MEKFNRKDSIATLHRENIINAADELFTANGFEKTTMDDIASHSQYSKRTIYSYFTSKNEIYSYFVLNGAKFFVAELQKATTFSSDFIECYHELCRSMLYLYTEQYPYYEGVMGIMNSTREDKPSGALGDLYSECDKINALLESFFAKGQDDAFILQNVDIRRLVLITWSNLTSFIELASKKNDYVESVLHLTIDEFTMFGFNLILNAILSS